MNTCILTRNYSKNTSAPEYKSDGLKNALRFTPKQVLDKVSKADLHEHGEYSERTVSEEWKKYLSSASDGIITAALNNCDTSYVLCSLLEQDPYIVLEGIAITAYALNIKRAEIYIPEKKEEIAEKVKAAYEHMDPKGIIPVEIHLGMPDVRTFTDGQVIHHIGTLASISSLFTVEDYKPTRIVEFSGSVNNPGIKEIPMGLSLRELISKYAGGLSSNQVKAVSIGSKLADASMLDTTIEENTSLGSGVINIYDNTKCMVNEGKLMAYIIHAESCGKCTFCREGSNQLYQIFKDITEGNGKTSDPDMIEEIGNAMKFSSLCSMGMTASDFSLGVIKYFKDELDRHIRRKQCPAEVCKAFMNIYISPDICTGCTDCMDICDKGAIEGKEGYIHMIDEFDCNKCGKCINVCNAGAVIRTSGRLPKLPERLTRVGRWKKH